jgi:AcrR family transcriptional regulator
MQQDTRARLLEAAFHIIAESGVAAASIRGVCERAGFSQGAFYSNFASKDELLLVLMERYMAEIATVLDGVVERSGDSSLEETLCGIASRLAELARRPILSLLAIELQAEAGYSSASARHRPACGMVRLDRAGDRRRRAAGRRTHHADIPLGHRLSGNRDFPLASMSFLVQDLPADCRPVLRFRFAALRPATSRRRLKVGHSMWDGARQSATWRMTSRRAVSWRICWSRSSALSCRTVRGSSGTPSLPNIVEISSSEKPAALPIAISLSC